MEEQNDVCGWPEHVFIGSCPSFWLHLAPFSQMQTKDDLTMLLTAQKRSKCSSLTAKIIPIKHGLSNSHIRTIQAPTLLTSSMPYCFCDFPYAVLCLKGSTST